MVEFSRDAPCILRADWRGMPKRDLDEVEDEPLSEEEEEELLKMVADYRAGKLKTISLEELKEELGLADDDEQEDAHCDFLREPAPNSSPSDLQARKPAGCGILHEYADVDKIPLEDGAWSRSVSDRSDD